MNSSVEVLVLECPQCAAPVQKGSNICPNCFSEYMVRSVNKLHSLGGGAVDKYLSAYRKGLASSGESMEIHFSMGLCFLEKKLYDYAIKSFEKAIGLLPENGDVYYYAAISILKGRKPFILSRIEINKMEEYLQVALMLEPRGIYYYFQAYIKYDYFSRKAYKTFPTYIECLDKARENGLLDDEAQTFYETAGVDRPGFL